MDEAIWGAEGLSGEAGTEGSSEGLSREVGMEGGGAGNLGWKWVKQKSGNGSRWNRQFGVKWVKQGSGNRRGWSRQFGVEMG